MNILAPADSAGGAGEEESLPGAREPGQLLALYQAAHLILLLPRAPRTPCLSLAPHVVRQVPGVGPVSPDQLSLAHPRQRGVTHVTSRTCTQEEIIFVRDLSGTLMRKMPSKSLDLNNVSNVKMSISYDEC